MATIQLASVSPLEEAAYNIYTAFTPSPNITTNTSASYYCYGHSDTTETKVLLLVILLLIIVGMIGNTLSVLVFSSKDMASVSSHVYLLILACSDTGHLISAFFVKVLPGFKCSFAYHATYDPYNTSAFGCAFFQSTTDLSADLSSCMVLAFTVERFLAVYRPADYRAVCTTHRAKVISMVFMIVITTLILPYHIMFMRHDPVSSICTMSKEHQKLFSTLYFAEATVFRIIPVFLIAILNALVVRHFRKSRMRPNIRSAGDRRTRRDETMRRLTRILFLVSITYIISYLPSLVHFLVWKMHRHEIIQLHDSKMTETREYVNVLYIMGFSINFFLYTVSGPVFRQSLLQLFQCHRCRMSCWFRFFRCCLGPTRQSSLVQTDNELQTVRPTELEESVPLKECNGAYETNDSTEL